MKITNEDNMELMARYPDNYFDLAIVDPPYGIGASEMQMGNNKKKKWNIGKKWDNSIPNKEYFEELKRVSKNQIVWGGNYFELPPTKHWVIWDKNNGNSDFADGEMAWCSLNKQLKIVKIHWCGSASNWEDTNGKIHPTQKPVQLYKWILDKYAKQGDRILDTHLGSGSISIACHDYGFDLTACELDKEYFDKAMERINNHVAQQKLF
jgi:site-specific DNA-methyltransferase (adenine-specific)